MAFPHGPELPLEVLKLIIDGFQPLALDTGYAAHLLVHGLHQLSDALVGEDVSTNLLDDHLIQTGGRQDRRCRRSRT